jgi:hypothetical protein
MVAAAAAKRVEEARDYTREEDINATAYAAANWIIVSPVTDGEGCRNISSVHAYTWLYNVRRQESTGGKKHIKMAQTCEARVSQVHS